MIENCANGLWLYCRGATAESEVVLKVDPQAPDAFTNSPPVEAWTQLPDVRVETEKLPLTVEDAETNIPFADPLTEFGKMKVSVRLVIDHGTVVTACAVKGKRSSRGAMYLNNLSSRIYIIIWGHA